MLTLNTMSRRREKGVIKQMQKKNKKNVINNININKRKM